MSSRLDVWWFEDSTGVNLTLYIGSEPPLAAPSRRSAVGRKQQLETVQWTAAESAEQSSAQDAAKVGFKLNATVAACGANVGSLNPVPDRRANLASIGADVSPLES